LETTTILLPEGSMEVMFVAAENGGIEGGKVGGIGDVIRDLPPALAAPGCRVTVVIPLHGYLHLGFDSTKIGAWRFLFRGELQTADIFEVFPPNASPGVTQLVIHHPALSAVDASSGAYHIHTHDPPDSRNGFTFSGDTLEKQADGFVRATLEAVALKRQNPAAWEKISKNAAATRFRWKEAADRYVQELYR
jgi:glycogen synthase